MAAILSSTRLSFIAEACWEGATIAVLSIVPRACNVRVGLKALDIGRRTVQGGLPTRRVVERR